MVDPKPKLVGMPARCFIVRRPGLPRSGWDLTALDGSPLFHAADFWEVLHGAFREGFEEATVKDGTFLYFVKIVQID